jgi:hypothetical protein
MRRIALTLSTIAVCGILATQPAAAAGPGSRACQPTFDPVTSLAATIDYLEAGWDRPLTDDEKDMAAEVFGSVDKNLDGTICIKIASVVPAPSDPVPQAIDNRLPVR